MAWNRPDGRSGAPSVFIRVHPWFHRLLTATDLRLSGKALACLLVRRIALDLVIDGLVANDPIDDIGRFDADAGMAQNRYLAI
jgi:hypothetical protein